MSEDYKLHYKEKPVSETVKNLKNIIKELDIELEEEKFHVPNLNTYSNRIVIKGTEKGTNGKGISSDYCEASAYAEFFERLQNMTITSGAAVFTKDKSDNNFYYYYDEKWMTSDELVECNSIFLQKYFELHGMEGSSKEEKIKKFDSVNYGEYYKFNKKDSFLTLPYYNCYKSKVEYLPYNMHHYIYGSNGMAAGNTMPEALVQGLSEIVERHTQMKIVTDKLTPPNIPETVIKKYPRIYKMYKIFKKQPNLDCCLKDCSVDGIIPSVALLIIEKNTRKCGLRFGAHPSLEIAMERVFTEATQGCNELVNFYHKNNFSFKNKMTSSSLNISNLFQNGVGNYPYQFFGDTPSYECSKFKDVSNLTNKELLQDILNKFKKQGYQVLIRDVSFLGFPSCRIIIPGYSEPCRINDNFLDYINLKFFVSELLKKPNELTKSTTKIASSCVDFFLPVYSYNIPSVYFSWIEKSNLPLNGDNTLLGCLYLSSMLLYICEEYNSSLSRLNQIINSCKSYSKNKDNIDFLKAVYTFIEGKANNLDNDEILIYVNKLFNKGLCDKIKNIFCGSTNCIDSQYERYSEEKDENDARKKLIPIHEKLKEAQIKNKINQSNLSTLLQ